MKIMIVDDDALVRDGLKIILELEEDIEVVAVAVNGKEAFDLCKEIQPDLVLMDIRMAQYDGIYGTKMIKESFKDIKILMLTTFNDEAYIKEAIKSGAEGYMLKSQSADVIVNGIRTLFNGSFVCEKGVMNTLKDMISIEPVKNLKQSMLLELSARELEILKLISEGLNNQEIAQKLFIGQGTVRNYVTSLLDKLKLRDRTQLAIFFLT